MKRIAGLVLVFFSLWAAAAEPTLVYLVRHAEKVDASRDPDLSPRGYQRVEMLVRFFEHIPLAGVYASQFQRTQKTVSPIAARQRLKVAVVDAGRPEQLVAALRNQPGKAFLVAGHSNTLPQLIGLLGGPSNLTIADDRYSDLFLLILDGEKTILQHFQLDPSRLTE